MNRYRLATLLLGFVLGAAFMHAFSASRIEQLLIENERLVHSIQETEASLENLRSSLGRRPRHVVEEVLISCELVGAGDRTEVEKALRPLGARFIGREVSELDPALVHDIFHERLLETKEHTYNIQVVSIVLASRTLVNVRAREVKKAEASWP